MSSDVALGAIIVASVLVATGCPSPSLPYSTPDSGVSDAPGDADATGFVRAEAIALDTLDPSASFDDLEPLRPLLESRPLVLLGESDHGVAELKEAKLRMIAFLYYELGRTTVADELGRAQANLVNRYLDSGDEAIIEELDLLQYASFSRVEEQLAFFRGLHQLVVDRPSELPPLRYRGFDLDHGRLNARDEVLAYLEEAANEPLRQELAPLVACIDVTTECAESLSSAVSSLQEAEAPLVAASSPEAYHEAQDVLLGLGETVRFYMLIAEGDPAAEQYREDVMMRRADEYIAAASGSIILSAHNLHIARARSSISPVVSVGEHVVSGASAEAAFVLAASYSTGSHLTRDDSWTFLAEEVGPPAEGSLEAILQRSGMDRFVLPFGNASPADPSSSWLHSPMGCVAAGYGVVHLVPADQWDGIIFIERATATTPLP